jgi:hypothetical protein
MVLCRTPLARIRRARVAASIFAMLALFAQLGSIAHLAVVKHVTCAEHGEMVDVADQPGAVAAHVDSRAAERRFDGADELAHGHDHCPMAAFRRQRVLARATERPLSLPATATHRFILGARATPARAIALLHLAPKSSPPLV